MSVSIEEIGPNQLETYSQISIAFTVTSVLSIETVEDGLGGILLNERPVETPYIKDYDAFDSGGPSAWPAQFDIRNWGFLLAYEGSHPVGGAAIAHDTPTLHMLAGRRDLAVLWDIRVSPEARRSGVGTLLIKRSAAWARGREARQLKIETQNINVPACRFYAKQGCNLGEINRYAYAQHPELAHETMLIWYLDL
jgi:GNAT superfamily N-acetyltransferase